MKWKRLQFHGNAFVSEEIFIYMSSSIAIVRMFRLHPYLYFSLFQANPRISKARSMDGLAFMLRTRSQHSKANLMYELPCVVVVVVGVVSSPIFFSNLRISMWSENNWFPQFLAFSAFATSASAIPTKIQLIRFNWIYFLFISSLFRFFYASTSLSNLLWLCKLNFSTDQIIHIKWKWIEQGIRCFSVQLTFIVQAAEYY